MQSGKTTRITDLAIEQSITEALHLTDKEKIEKMVGKRVQVQHHYHGKVIGSNTSPYGAFPASHYPILVELDSDFHGKLHQKHAFKLSDIQILE